MIAKSMGRPVPEGWLRDLEGRPTTDASGYPDRSVLQPIGGYKGYGPAVLVEVLCGILIGASFLSSIHLWINESGGRG